MTQAEMIAEIQRLKTVNAELTAKIQAGKRPATISLKVAERSGALSVYGLGRFPVSLYKEQWVRLLDRKDEILAFIQTNSDRLASKQ